MAEENQVQQELKEPQQVTMKDPKKVEEGKRLTAINHKKKEAKKREDALNGGLNQYYGIGTIIAVGVIGGLGYYIYRTKQPLHGPHTQLSNPPTQPLPLTQTNKFEMD